MSSDVYAALDAAHALNRRATRSFISQYLNGLDLEDWRFLKRTVLDVNRFDKNIIADAPLEVLLHIYQYLEPTAPLLHRLVCKKWNAALTSTRLWRLHTTNWLDASCFTLVCQQKKELEVSVVLKALETMHRFQTGNPAWSSTFDFSMNVPRMKMLGDIFMYGPFSGEFRCINVTTGQMSAHWFMHDHDDARYLAAGPEAVFFQCNIEDPMIHAINFPAQTSASLPAPLTPILSFVANGQQAAVLLGADPVFDGAQAVLWNSGSGKAANADLPKFSSLMPRELKDREILDCVWRLHVNADNTLLTVLLLGQFKWNLKHDDECVILLFGFKLDLAAADTDSRLLDTDSVHVEIAYCTGTDHSTLQDAVLPIEQFEWAKTAHYSTSAGAAQFEDHNGYLCLNVARAEFCIGEVKKDRELNNHSVFSWKGTIYSAHHSLPQSRNLTEYLANNSQVYTISPWSEPPVQPSSIEQELDVEDWRTERVNVDPCIVGDPRVLFFGTCAHTTVLAFDPDIIVPERFFDDEWDGPFENQDAPSPSERSNPGLDAEDYVWHWNRGRGRGRGHGRGRGRGRGGGMHNNPFNLPLGRGRGRGGMPDNDWQLNQWGEQDYVPQDWLDNDVDEHGAVGPADDEEDDMERYQEEDAEHVLDDDADEAGHTYEWG